MLCNLLWQNRNYKLTDATASFDRGGLVLILASRPATVSVGTGIYCVVVLHFKCDVLFFFFFCIKTVHFSTFSLLQCSGIVSSM